MFVMRLRKNIFGYKGSWKWSNFS